jgi:voltage-gated potassium channel
VHITAENKLTLVAVALVPPVFGLALSRELGLVLGQAAVELGLIAAPATGIPSMRRERQWRAARLGIMVVILVLFSGPINCNKMIGSFRIYRHLGIIWATLYMTLVEYRADAFIGLTAGEWNETFPNLVYLSFVTLATVV